MNRMQRRARRVWYRDAAGPMLVSVIVAVLLASAGGIVLAQCPGDCNGNGLADDTELLSVINRMFGDPPVSSCTSGDPTEATATMSEFVATLNVAVTALRARGACLRPGQTEDLIACAAGTLIRGFVCLDNAQCADNLSARRLLGTTVTDARGTFELGDCGEFSRLLGELFIFDAQVEAGVIYHTVVAGPASPGANRRASGAGRGTDGAPQDILISPSSQAAVNLMTEDELTLDSFVPQGISEIIAAVAAANAGTMFAGLDAAAAANVATGTARENSDVQEVIDSNLRPTPTVTRSATHSPTPSATITPTRTPTATPTPRRYRAYVANSADDTVSVIDTSTRQVIATLTVGDGAGGIMDNPRLVAVSPDGSTVVVSNFGERNRGSSLSLITVADNTVQPPIEPVPGSDGMSGIAFAPDFMSSKLLFATNLTSQQLFRINTETRASAAVGVDNKPYAIAIAQSGAFYITQSVSHFVARVLPTLAGVERQIPVGTDPHGIAIRPSSIARDELAFVANFGTNSVSVINLATNTPVPTPVQVGQAPEGIAVTPDGMFAYVTNLNSGTVSLIDTDAAQQNPGSAVVATVPVELQPFGVAITPDGAFAYVTNGASDSVSVIDTHLARTSPSHAVVAPIAVGNAPRGIAITPFEIP